MENEIGIAGWILSGEILREKTLTLLEFPEVCASYGVKTVELCSVFFESQDARYVNEVRKNLESNGLSVQNIAVDMGNIAGADPAVRRVDIETLKQWFYTASAVNSKAIRINTGHADDAEAMNRVMYHTAWKMGFRCYSTISKHNMAVNAAHRKNSSMVVRKELANDFILVEFVPPPVQPEKVHHP